MLYAVHTDGLVMGIGLSEAEAYADAEAHGSEDETLLTVAEITKAAAHHVQNGDDCRGLVFLPLTNGDDLIAHIRQAKGLASAPSEKATCRGGECGGEPSRTVQKNQ